MRPARSGCPRRKSATAGDDAFARLVFQQLDDLGADHHRIGHLADGLRGGRVADAEADADRDLHMRGGCAGSTCSTASVSRCPAPVTPLSDT